MSAPLRVAIVHYHLKRGGVARVIQSALRALGTLADPPKCVVLSGECPRYPDFSGTCVQVEGLQYSNAQERTPDAATLLERLKRSARKALGADPDVWHIHNHSLGKNSAMAGVVSLLADEGASLLLQIHDFAEDGRPGNFRLNQAEGEFATRIYPTAPRVQYAVINARDHALLAQTSIAPERLHLLSNPVEGEAVTSADSHASKAIRDTLDADRLFLYPVRAVRRKNFGEFLLWSALARKGDVFATTLGPTNQNYVIPYVRWQSFAAEHGLPVQFGLSEKFGWSFETVMRSANAMLSTSIAEGFGLAFLEPWLYGKAIYGRDLPNVTSDFKAQGIDLGALYTNIPIPGEWIDLEALCRCIATGIEASYAAYDTTPPVDAVERALDAITLPDGCIDFAGLNESLQESIIVRMAADPTARSTLPLQRMFQNVPPDRIARNADLIRLNYGLETYAKHLDELYRGICSQSEEKPEYLPPKKLLQAFLQPERFRLLRT